MPKEISSNCESAELTARELTTREQCKQLLGFMYTFRVIFVSYNIVYSYFIDMQ